MAAVFRDISVYYCFRATTDHHNNNTSTPARTTTAVCRRSSANGFIRSPAVSDYRGINYKPSGWRTSARGTIRPLFIRPGTYNNIIYTAAVLYIIITVGEVAILWVYQDFLSFFSRTFRCSPRQNRCRRRPVFRGKRFILFYTEYSYARGRV